MHINFDFGDLEAFIAVKETGSFHVAAERLNLSQSAVTRRIRKLESALDTLLFERTTRAVRPTLAAKRLQVRAEAMLDDARETAQAMRDESVAHAHQRGAVVSVASIATVVVGLLGPALRLLREQGTVPRVRLLDGSANEVAEAVSLGEADFGICSIPMLEPGLEFQPLFDDRIVVALPDGHPLAGRASVFLADLMETPLILPARGTGNRVLIDEAMAKSRVILHWTYEVGRSASAIDLVASGAGAALVPESAAMGAGLNTCTLMTPTIARPVGLLLRTGQSETQAARSLKQALAAIARG